MHNHANANSCYLQQTVGLKLNYKKNGIFSVEQYFFYIPFQVRMYTEKYVNHFFHENFAISLTDLSADFFFL